LHEPEKEPQSIHRAGQTCTTDIVKLIFRFADENADREDGQCERMWVEITGFDEDGYFVGTIENDPHHTADEYGDVVSFHPLQIAEIYVDGE
jgi:uncharacterized protein YegJ (DUF2314 family)